MTFKEKVQTALIGSAIAIGLPAAIFASQAIAG